MHLIPTNPGTPPPPAVHGFDEFFGNLYHLNAEEEPEQVRLHS
jgi:arylsulfatase A-like enzyme